MIIGVTGSRDWKSREITSQAFDEAFTDFGDPACPNIVITGGAAGADTICFMEAAFRGWHPATVPANWGFYGRKMAGRIRNDAMIYLGMNADAWLGFINPCIRKDCPMPKPHDSHGTTRCLGSARKAGISVREYRNG